MIAAYLQPSFVRVALLTGTLLALLWVGAPSGAKAAFTGPSNFPTGIWPVAVATGDFNGDSRPDLAVANFDSNDLSVLIGRPGGSFAPGSSVQVGGNPLPAGRGPIAVAVGDFNGDSDLDLAVANYNTNDVSILLGGPGGTFTPAIGSPIAVDRGPISIAIADFNGDSDPDLAIANGSSSNVSVLLGGTGASFTPALGSPFATGKVPFSVAVGDFNGDSDPDLAVANFSSNNISVLLGGPGGSFAPAAGSPVTVGTGPKSVAVGDFNGDSDPDLAVANSVSNDVSVLLGGSGASFAPAAGGPFPAGTSPGAIVVGDFNRDSDPDLAVANIDSNDVTVLLGGAGGGFTEPALESPVAAGQNPSAIAVGDFNGDSNPDLAVPNYISDKVSVLYGGATPSFVKAGSPLPVDSGAISVAVADFNGDFHPDFGVASRDSDDVFVYFGGAAASFTAAPGSPLATERLPHSVVAGDFNGDHRPDLAVANLGADNVSILLANGSGGFVPSPGSPFATGRLPYALATGDFNGDRRLDLAVANEDESTVSILIGDGSGNFAASGTPIPVGLTPFAVAVADFNGDRRADLAVANFGTNDISILVGDGTGGFTVAGSRYPSGQSPISIAVADFNGDSDPDLAVANRSSNDVSILVGGAGASFTDGPGSPYPVGTLPFSVAAGDFNGDSDPDLALATTGAGAPGGGPSDWPGYVSILFGGAGAGFRPAAGISVPEGTQPRALAVADFNGDSEPDLVVANEGSNDVWILLGIRERSAPGRCTKGRGPAARRDAQRQPHGRARHARRCHRERPSRRWKRS